MDSSIKNFFTRFGKKDEVNLIFKKLMSKDIEMSRVEKEKLLFIAIQFMKMYVLDKNNKVYIEFSYHIILRYSLLFNDYKPLYDFALSMGFNPIVKEIEVNKLLTSYSVVDIINNSKLEYFLNGEITETVEQKKVREGVEYYSNKNDDYAVVAPTSYGKSELIVNDIINNLDCYNYFFVIVPSKSLLHQTYTRIKNEDLKIKVIIHDEMYNNDDRFIGVFTQERALRLMELHNIYPDLVYIDEAHKLFDFDSDLKRSLLLARFIKKVNLNNNACRIRYFSPLIEDVKNLSISNTCLIKDFRIDNNIKDLDFHVYYDNKCETYNRFLNQFYCIKSYSSAYEYINDTCQKKNFMFLASPKKIEMFAVEFSNHRSEMINNEINEITDMLTKYIGSYYYNTKLIRKGIIYIHAKIPDQIKEYLEYKFKECNSIDFLIGNSVILEGINMPIDNMYILGFYNQTQKDKINLMGRVNRLNEIFNKNENRLNKLLPPIHFVQNEFDSKRRNVKSQVEKFRVLNFPDEIKNPILDNYEMEDKISLEEKEEIEKVVEIERQYFELTDESDVIRKKLISHNLIHIYSENDIDYLIGNIGSCKNIKGWSQKEIVDKIYITFIKEFDLKDYEIDRLKNKEARDYYNKYTTIYRHRHIKEQVENNYKYFKDKDVMYVGRSYGEYSKIGTIYYKEKSGNVYVKPSEKTKDELKNLIIVKLKMEDDFIRYKYNKFVQILFELECITENEYNISIYGTEDVAFIQMLKMGLPINIATFISENNMIDEVEFDEFNRIITSDTFNKFICEQDDYIKYHIRKYI